MVIYIFAGATVSSQLETLLTFSDLIWLYTIYPFIMVGNHRDICGKATKIIIITVHKMGAYILKALRLGVSGYFNKENVVEELIPALSRVASGGSYFGSEVSDYLAQAMEQTKSKPQPQQAIGVLNEREQDVLRLVAEGKTAREIAKILFLSRRTVENYKNNILKKLNLHKTSELIKYAVENKLLEGSE